MDKDGNDVKRSIPFILYADAGILEAFGIHDSGAQPFAHVQVLQISY